MKHLTEKKAWMVIARAFEKPLKFDKDGITSDGLCLAIGRLESMRLISYGMWVHMKMRISEYGDANDRQFFFWSCTPRNRPKRAALARQFAGECDR